MNVTYSPSAMKSLLASALPLLPVRALVLSGLGLCAHLGLAQTKMEERGPGPVVANPAAPVSSEPTIELSPFVVGASADVGYEATESLAGTGLKTKLTDIGASVSVINSKFLEDTGSTNLRELLVYQTNMETTGFGGNLSGAEAAPGGVAGEPSLSAGSPGTRVRGLAEATQARNFFRSFIPMDSYNTERVEINRGANALLFGVGSPAGIINTTTAGADLRKQAGSVDVSADSNGTYRGVLKYNHVLLPNELAIRIGAVHAREKFQQKFAFTDSDRQYVAGAWDVRPLRNRGLLSSTTLRASYEQGEIASNRPRTLTPSDRLSSWFSSTLPDDLEALGAREKVSYDPTRGPFNVFSVANRNASIGVIENVNRSPTLFFQDVTATSPRDNVPVNAAGQTVIGRPMVSNNVFFPSTGLTGIAVAAYTREMSRLRTDYGLPDGAFYTSENLTDPSVFDFFNNTLIGPNSEGLANLKALDLSLEQLVWNRKAGFEAAFSRQTWDEGLQSLMPQSAPYISIDVNTRLWTGEANPNFGRPFVSTAGRATYNEVEAETARAKAFVEIDLRGRERRRLGWFLGRHIVSGLVQQETLTTENRGGGSTHYTPDFWANGNNQARTAGQSKQIVTWVYLGPSLAAASSPSGARLPGLQQNLLNFQDTLTSQNVILQRVPAPTAAVAGQAQYQPTYGPLTILRENREVTNTASFASLNQRTLDSQALSLQSYLLGDLVVGTVGWRKEQSSIIGTNAPFAPGGEGYVLVDSPSYSLDRPDLVPQDFEQTLFAWSAVAKTPDRWLRRVPVLSALNLYYGESENFSPPETRTVDAFRNEIPPPSGLTEEGGVYLEAFNGRVSLRLNSFKTTQTGSFNSAVGGIPATIVGLHTTVFGMVRSGLIADGGNGFPAGYVAPPDDLLRTFAVQIQPSGFITSTNPGVRDTSDFVTEGKEIELSFRPTRGLSFILNIAQQQSVRSNTGAAVRRLLFDTPTATGASLAAEWQKPWARQIALNAGALGKEGSTDINLLGNNFLLNALNRYNVAASGDGAPVQELREWRVNLVGSYQFQEGRLKGWGVGGGLRWQDKAAIGFPVATFESDLSPSDGIAEFSDLRISDVRNPYFGPTETRADAWVSYATKLFRNRIPLKIQLNVRNLFTHDELVPTVANPDGSIPVWAIAEGRKFTLSAKFSF
ncbi:MAG: TonB-dependent receptor plug domain-containing protein [Opitutaceae bacterium]|nr:TonB-dependent receptor plug domain-containing protein [Opitutaceae bacterium]